MYELVFYEDNRGQSDVKNYIETLKQKSKTDKESRIVFYKIIAYFDALTLKGTRLDKKVTKYLGDDIWELRPLKTRILYAYYKNNTFIILHYFIKKTMKTPKKELEQAKRNLKSFLERSENR